MQLLNYHYFVLKLHRSSYIWLVLRPTLPATCRNPHSHIVTKRLFIGSRFPLPLLHPKRTIYMVAIRSDWFLTLSRFDTRPVRCGLKTTPAVCCCSAAAELQAELNRFLYIYLFIYFLVAAQEAPFDWPGPAGWWKRRWARETPFNWLGPVVI